MDALEMQRGLMLVGIADGPERVMGLKRDAPQSVARGRYGAIGEVAPMTVVQIMQLRRMIENKTNTFEGDEPICKLVLDRLKPSDRLAELAALPGVVGHQFERPERRTLRARRQGELSPEQEIVKDAIVHGNACDRRRGQPNLIGAPRTHGSGRRDVHAFSVQREKGQRGAIDCDKQMRTAPRGLYEPKQSNRSVVPDLDRRGPRIRIERPERKR